LKKKEIKKKVIKKEIKKKRVKTDFLINHDKLRRIMNKLVNEILIKENISEYEAVYVASEFKRVVDYNLTNREIAFSLKNTMEKEMDKIGKKPKKSKEEIKKEEEEIEEEAEEEYDYSRMIS